MPKKIIFTVTNDLVHDQRMHKICTSLTAAGFEVKLVGRIKKDSKPLQSKAFFQHRIYVFFQKGKFFYIEYNIKLFFYLLFQSADIFGAVDLDTIAPCVIAAKLRGKKITYDAHEYFTEVPEVVNRPFIKKIWLWVEKIFVPKTDVCYTVSNSLALLYMDKYKKKFHIIKNCPTLLPAVASQIKEPKFILYQGALNTGRGLAELLYAMKQLPIELKIAGEGDLSHQLRQLAKELQVENKVGFMGWVSPEELKKLTPSAFVGYNLLENIGKSYYFSLSNKYFDYMHAEVPGISNDFPEYKAINNEYEVGVLTNLSVEDIVLNINKLLNEPGFYKRLKENCVAAKEKFNWQNEEKVLKQLYEELG